jgi:hypothetical protein
VGAGQLVHTTGVREGLEHHPPGPFTHQPDRIRNSAGRVSTNPTIAADLSVGGAQSLTHPGEHVTEHTQQPLGFRAVLFAQLLQVLAGLLGDDRHALAEHAHHLIPSPDTGGVHQTRQQRQPLLHADIAQLTGIGHRGLPGEVPNFRWRDPGQPLLRGTQLIEPTQER